MKASRQLGRIRENLKAMEPSFVVFPEVGGTPISINRDILMFIRPSKKDPNTCEFVMIGGKIIKINRRFEDIFETIEDPDNGVLP